MRFYLILIAVFTFLLATNINGQESRKEVVIVGTMHTVPKIIRNAYKPMLRKAKKYAPENIYVEYIPSSDVESIDFQSPWFLELSDSVAQKISIDRSRVEKLMLMPLVNLRKVDFVEIKNHFLLEKDLANYRYYEYLSKYGLEGSKKSQRNENTEVSFKLAIHQGIKQLNSMDHQSSNVNYYQYWRACDSTLQVGIQAKELKKLQKRMYRNEVIGTILRGFARQTNRKSTLESYHESNSFTYFENTIDVCQEGEYWWDYRNEKMADHIASQVNASASSKNLVVVGAGHVVGIQKILQVKYPELLVRTLY